MAALLLLFLLLLQPTRSQNLDHYLLLSFPRTPPRFWPPIDPCDQLLDPAYDILLNGCTSSGGWPAMSMWHAADAGISKLSAGEATGDCMISAGDIPEVRTKHRKARSRRLIARHLACGDLFRAAGQAGKCVTVERIFPRAVENLSMQIGRQSKLSGGLREAQQEVVVKVLRSGGLEEPRRGRSVGRIYFVGATRRRNPSSWVAPVRGEKAYFSCNSGGATPSWRGGK